MAEASGIVSTLVGRAIARSPDGSERELRVGDAVRPDDVIITAEGSFLELDMPDGPSVVVSERLEFAFTEELFDQGFSETESSVDDNTVDAILAALESGGDLLEELEAPAAGAGGAAGTEGHSFVRLGRIDFGLDVEPFEITDDVDEFPELDGQL